MSEELSTFQNFPDNAADILTLMIYYRSCEGNEDDYHYELKPLILNACLQHDDSNIDAASQHVLQDYLYFDLKLKKNAG